MGLVPGGLFRVEDDLGELGRFNWGGLVYDFFGSEFVFSFNVYEEEN